MRRFEAEQKNSLEVERTREPRREERRSAWWVRLYWGKMRGREERYGGIPMLSEPKVCAISLGAIDCTPAGVVSWMTSGESAWISMLRALVTCEKSLILAVREFFCSVGATRFS